MRTNKVLFGIGLLGIAMHVSACASIVTGSHQEVTFNSNPDDAIVHLNGRVLGKTPITTSLKKKPGQTLVFDKEGYQPLTMELETRMNSWFWGNIVLGGVIGSTTDGLSGAVNEYSPSQYMVTLQPAGASSLETNTAISARQKRKDYVVRNYDQIVIDLAKGTGEYLSSLLSLLNVPADQRNSITKRIRAMSEAYPDIIEFSDHVIDEFGG